MKKLMALLLALMMIGGGALAEEEVFHYFQVDMDGVRLTVPMPADLPTFTRYMEADNPLFAEYEMDGAEALAYMEARSIYLDALTPDGSREFYMSGGVVEETFDGLDDVTMSEMAAYLATLVSGVTVETYAVCDAAGAKWVLLWQTADNGLAGLQCYTMHNGVAVNITYSGSDPSLLDADEELLMELLKQVEFPA